MTQTPLESPGREAGANGPPPGASSRGLARVLAAVAALGVVCAALLYLVTWGRRGLFDAPLDYKELISSSFYDAQASSLLSGRLDVPCSATRGESFVIDGRCYGYFGPTPALLRVPLNALLPKLAGRWSRFMLLAAAVLSTLGVTALAWRLLRGGEIHSRERLALLLCYTLTFSLGGCMVFLIGNPWTYHEAVAWGSALAVLAFLALDLSLERDSLPWLVAAILLGGLAANSRVTVGLGPLVAAGAALVAGLGARCGLRRLEPLAPALRPWKLGLALGLTLAAAATPFLWNLVRFGTPGLPLEKQIIYSRNPARLEQASRGILSPGNLPCTLSAYWSPRSIGFVGSFPWLVPGVELWELPQPHPPALSACRGSTVNHADPITSLPWAIPAQLALALGGIAAVRRWRSFPWKRYACPVLGAAAAAAPIHLYHTLSYRYVQDLFPLLAILGTAGLGSLARVRPRAVRWTLVVVLVLLAMWGLYMNVSVSLTQNLLQPEAVEWALAIRPDHVIFLAKGAAIELQTGDLESASGLISRGLALDPDHAPLLLLETECAARQGRWEVASRAARRAVRLEPGSAPAWNALGNVRYMTGDQQAVEAYRRALELDPANPEARSNLQRALVRWPERR